MYCLRQRPSFHPAERNLRHGDGDPTLHVPLRLHLPSLGDDSESRVTASYSPRTDLIYLGFSPLRMSSLIDFLTGYFHTMYLLEPSDAFTRNVLLPH